MKRLFSLLILLIVFPSCINNNEACPAVYEPVCGSNGVTYGNDCHARNEGITEYTSGECSFCYEIFAPVCGSDGNTYSNDCYARAAGITDYTEGECTD